MKELFDRNSPKVNIGLVGNNHSETTEEKIAKLEGTKAKLKGAIIDENLKEALLKQIDDSIEICTTNHHHR